MPRRKAATGGGLRITAAICAGEAQDGLARAVDSVIEQSLPKDRYELVLIGDDTAKRRVERPHASLTGVPNVRWIKQAGKDRASARDAAVEQSQAPLIAFLDENAAADHGWLASLCRTFDQFGKAAQVVGGRVRPLWTAPRPPWLGNELLAELSLVELGDTARFLENGETIADVNIAFRRDQLVALGGFRGAEDRRPGSSPLDRLAAEGRRAIYDPQAIADYAVPADRLTQDWFRSRAAWRAVADLMQSRSNGSADPSERWRALKQFFFECPPAERTVRGLVLTQQDPRRFQEQVSAVYDTLYCLLSGVGESDYD